jgi:tRNA A37 N6-isopentenylltransferase MiaA
MLEGARTLEDAIARAKSRTRQLAKRQLTWFRHQATLRVVKVESTIQQTKERIRELVENARRQDS